jgi:hypothetical protein
VIGDALWFALASRGVVGPLRPRTPSEALSLLAVGVRAVRQATLDEPEAYSPVRELWDRFKVSTSTLALAAIDMLAATGARESLAARPAWAIAEGAEANARVDNARAALLALCGDGPALVAPGFVPSPPGAPSNLPEPRAETPPAAPFSLASAATKETATIPRARELARRFAAVPADSAAGRVRVAIEGWFSDGEEPQPDPDRE